MATTLRFRKASDKDFVHIPEVGRVTAGQVLEGPQWKKYVPLGLLEEIPFDNPFTKPEDFHIPKKKSPPKAPKAPKPPPDPEPSQPTSDEEGEAEAPAEAPDPDPEPAPKPTSSPKAASSAKMKKRAAARRKR